jgi:hypothetical protein
LRIFSPLLDDKTNCDSEPIFEESRTVDYDTSDGSKELDKQHRDSQSAYLPFTDVEYPRYEPLHCIEQRAAQFQGHAPIENFENLQVVRSFPPTPSPSDNSGMARGTTSAPISTGSTPTETKLSINPVTAQPPSSCILSPTVRVAQPSSPTFRDQRVRNGVIS